MIAAAFRRQLQKGAVGSREATKVSNVADLRDSGQRLNDRRDVYIGAIARAQQVSVLTANVDHFERLERVQVIDWTTFWRVAVGS